MGEYRCATTRTTADRAALPAMLALDADATRGLIEAMRSRIAHRRFLQGRAAGRDIWNFFQIHAHGRHERGADGAAPSATICRTSTGLCTDNPTTAEHDAMRSMWAEGGLKVCKAGRRKPRSISRTDFLAPTTNSVGPGREHQTQDDEAGNGQARAGSEASRSARSR
mgnify:CR=1 FL=1